MNWETLLEHPHFVLRRCGRFLVADLKTPHRVLSTSFGTAVRPRVCASCSTIRAAKAPHITLVTMCSAADGLDAYHDLICAEAEVRPEHTAAMGTAANMNYAAISTERDVGLEVTAVVTAGVEGNATCAGDPAAWRETARRIEKAAALAGTINTMMLVSVPLTPAALARAVMTMTEGRARRCNGLPCRAANRPTSPREPAPTSTASLHRSPPDRFVHVDKPACQAGRAHRPACRKATQEALRWQNGLEASYTRGVFHALGRYGVKEATFFDDIAPWLDADDLELLRKNSKAALYEPLVGAAAHAPRLFSTGSATVRCRRRCSGSHHPAGGAARRQPRRAAAALAGVSRGAPRHRVHRSEDDFAGRHRARLVAEVAFPLTNALAPAASVLAFAVLLDLALGDPVYRGHPYGSSAIRSTARIGPAAYRRGRVRRRRAALRCSFRFVGGRRIRHRPARRSVLAAPRLGAACLPALQPAGDGRSAASRLAD